MRSLTAFALSLACALGAAGCATGGGAEDLGDGGSSNAGGAGGSGSAAGSGGHGAGGAAGAGGGWPGECAGQEQKGCYTGPAGTEGVGACKSGQQTCESNTWGACQGDQLPSDEKCNGVDDDCDGQVDENNPEAGVACDSKKPGVCAAGTSACQGGQVVCTPNTQASAEKCDGADNDCDGQTDEGCNCVDGTSQSCYTGAPGSQGVGPCKGGNQTCSGGTWGTCLGQVVPGTEICNGQDDDCDGQTDDGNPGGGSAGSTGLSGICSAGTQQCQAGSLKCTQNQQAAPSDTCGNGLDDNCNGQTDENCGCAHDVCSTGVKLGSGCDSATGNCVSKVCAVDSFCCTSTWDTLCVSRVRTECKSLKCAESKGNCSHTLCTTGAALTSGCDSAKANCASKVCAVDPFCCNNSWDSLCVSKLPTYCSYNCL